MLAAAASGDPSAVVEVLEGGGSLEERDDDESTPIIVASRCGDDDIVSVLLMAGADPSAEDIVRCAPPWRALLAVAALSAALTRVWLLGRPVGAVLGGVGRVPRHCCVLADRVA